MTIYVPWWGFLIATAFVLAVLALGVAAGRAERRGRRELDAAERKAAAERTIRFASSPDLLDVPSWMAPMAAHGRMPINPGYPPPPPVDLAAYNDDEPWHPPTPDADRTVDDDEDYPRAGLAGDIGRDIEEGMDAEGDPDDDDTEQDSVDLTAAVTIADYDMVINGHTVHARAAYLAPPQPQPSPYSPPTLRWMPMWVAYALALYFIAAEEIGGWLRDVRASIGAERSPGWDTQLGHLLLTSDRVEPDHECVGRHCGHETAPEHDIAGKHRSEYRSSRLMLTARAA